jgi:hypothetical protein
MKYLLCFLLLPTIAFATSLDKKIASANAAIQSLPEYSCFREYYVWKSQLPWEKSGIRYVTTYMLIRKNEKGFLFAQSDSDCKKKTSCGYWIRSTTYADSFISSPIEVSKCPKYLTKQSVHKLLNTEYADEFNLDN